MHKTEAAGHVAGAYVDQALPIVAGTVLAASDRNAVQDEITNVITRAGLTLKTAATETGDQLETVLFDTAITRTKEINFATATVTKSYIREDKIRLWDTTDNSQLILKAGQGVGGEVGLEYTNGTSNRTTKIGPSGVTVTGATLSGNLSDGGINYNGALAVFCKVFDASAITFTVDAAFAKAWASTDTLVLTGIPSTALIVSASLGYTGVGGSNIATAPAYLLTEDNGSGTMRVFNWTVFGGIVDPDLGTNQKLYVYYRTL